MKADETIQVIIRAYESACEFFFFLKYVYSFFGGQLQTPHMSCYWLNLYRCSNL